MATVEIYDLTSRVHEPEGQRLEIGSPANDVVLLVLGPKLSQVKMVLRAPSKMIKRS